MKNNENITARLLGAIIGLARATEGNVIPTIDTHRAMLTGMNAAHPDTEAPEQQISDAIELLHREKESLVPDCSSCAKPCGRNNDFDISEIDALDEGLSAAKRTLLSELLSLEPLLRCCPENDLFEQAMDSVYGGFFYVGYDCKPESIPPIISELEEIREKLTKQGE